MKAAIETLGCRVNIYDSEAMAELFLKDGYEIVAFNDKADVYVINTCTVTNAGDKKSRQTISRARRNNPEAVICVVGCYAQVAAGKIAALPGVNVVLGSRNKGRVVELANRSMVTGEQFVEVSDIMAVHDFEKLDIRQYQGKTRAFLKIQDGCNRFCTYCMIPYARGGISSKGRSEVIAEVKELEANGFKEIILSGIHISSYGMELAPPKTNLLQLDQRSYDLLDLLEEIERSSKIERIRIGSIEPMFFKGDRQPRIRQLHSLLPHFHLSLQSGSDSVLKRMNRRYTAAEFRAVVENLRREIPGVSITTDIITGFPGETEVEFEETCRFLQEIQLTKTHVFKYSPRDGTPAAGMEDQIAEDVKEARSRRLISLSEQNELQFIENHRAGTYRVLFENPHQGIYTGYTENYIAVRLKSEADLTGRILPVKITQAALPYSDCTLIV